MHLDGGIVHRIADRAKDVAVPAARRPGPRAGPGRALDEDELARCAGRADRVDCGLHLRELAHPLGIRYVELRRSVVGKSVPASPLLSQSCHVS